MAPDDWQTYKRIRLTALESDPSAFSSTLDHAQSLPDEESKARIDRSPVFIGEDGGVPAGLAIGIDIGEGAELISMWVAPTSRGTGLASRLIEAVVGWASGAGYDEIRLWVVEGNVAAEKAYAKSGFARTGRRQPVREGEPAIELEMARATTRPPRTA